LIEANASYLSPAARARMQHADGLRYWHEGKPATVAERFQIVAATYRALGDVRSEAEALANIGAAFYEIGAFENAEKALTEVMATAQRLDLRFLVAFCLGILSSVRFSLGRSESAFSLGEQSLEMARRQGDTRLEGLFEYYLSLSARRAGRLDEAERRARLATELLADVLAALPAAQAALAQAVLAQGRSGESLEHAQRAWDGLQELGKVEEGEALIRLAYAQALTAVDRADEARRVALEAAARLRERAEGISNSEWRETFLNRVPTNAESLSLARRLAGASDT